MIRAGLAAAALLFGAGPVPAPLVAQVAVSPEDAALFRDVLREVGPDYCVTSALAEAPFAGLRRDMADYAEMETEMAAMETEMAALEKRAPRLPKDPAERELALRDRVGWGWVTDARKPVEAALLARITDAAAKIAQRGDPTPLPADGDAVGELNTMDAEGVMPEPAATLQPPATPAAPSDDPLLAEADRLEAMADAAGPHTSAPRDHGQIERGWLAPGQRLAADCALPSATLSAIAREGDLAFLSIGTVWGPLAGHGETWAMQRTASGWRRVARRQDWIA